MFTGGGARPRTEVGEEPCGSPAEGHGLAAEEGRGGASQLLAHPAAFFFSRSCASAEGATGEEDGGGRPSHGGDRHLPPHLPCLASRVREVKARRGPPVEGCDGGTTRRREGESGVARRRREGLAERGGRSSPARRQKEAAARLACGGGVCCRR